VYQWCEFKSRRGKNNNLRAQNSKSNTVWFNFQTYIYIYMRRTYRRSEPIKQWPRHLLWKFLSGHVFACQCSDLNILFLYPNLRNNLCSVIQEYESICYNAFSEKIFDTLCGLIVRHYMKSDKLNPPFNMYCRVEPYVCNQKRKKNTFKIKFIQKLSFFYLCNGVFYNPTYQ